MHIEYNLIFVALIFYDDIVGVCLIWDAQFYIS